MAAPLEASGPAWLTRIAVGAGELVRNKKEIKKASPGDQTTIFDEVDKLSLYVFYLLSDEKIIKNAIDQYLSVWEKIRPVTTGHDLRVYKIPPGPKYQEILKEPIPR